MSDATALPPPLSCRRQATATKLQPLPQRRQAAAEVTLCAAAILLRAVTALTPPPSCRDRAAAANALSAATARSVLQEQEEATRARRYRFLKQNEREKLTYYLELKKTQ